MFLKWMTYPTFNSNDSPYQWLTMPHVYMRRHTCRENTGLISIEETSFTHLKLTTSPTSEKMSFSCSSVASYGMFPTEIINKWETWHKTNSLFSSGVKKLSRFTHVLYLSTILRYFTWVSPFSATLYFYPTTIQR